MGTHIFTSAALNYLPKARVLAQSIRRFHPDITIHLILCDKPPRSFRLSGEPFDQLWTLPDLDVPSEPSWLFQHTLVELSTAVKGFALVKLLERPDCERVIYFDPDIVVLAGIDQLIGKFEEASILLTPHVTEPDEQAEAIEDHEVSSLRHGVYNLGFLGVKKSPEGLRFAHWWRDRLRDFCRDDVPNGLFTDQRWADLIPAFFADCRVLRDPGYNVCTWNLTKRSVTGSIEQGLLANGEPLVFYHFSGFDRGAQKVMLDKYGSGMPALYELRSWYITACEEAGQAQFGPAPWAYGYFENGERILREQRNRYRTSKTLQQRFPNPYCTACVAESFLTWWNQQQDQLRSPVSGPRNEKTPEYRIFVIAAGGSRLCDEWLEALKGRTFCRESVHLASDFAQALSRLDDKDALLLRAGAQVPKFWDLRLAWSAARAEDALTVSPLIRSTLDPDNTLSRLTNDELDELCYYYRGPSDPEIAAFASDCVYIRAQALRELGVDADRRYPADLLEGAQRSRHVHRLATHICLDADPPTEQAASSGLMQRILYTVRSRDDRPTGMLAPSKSMVGANLHIMHSLGGGTEYWLRDYCAADTNRDQLVLRSFGTGDHHGTEWQLYRYTDRQFRLLRTWRLNIPIKACLDSHAQGLEILHELLRDYSPGHIMVSSLIGHSLDSLGLGLPVTFICHDYFPFCMALNLTFGETCRSCEPPRLRACVAENPLNRAFPNVPAAEWLALRRAFLDAALKSGAKFVAPSPSVIENYRQVMPELVDRLLLIPHGFRVASGPLQLAFDPVRPLRVLVLGKLLPLKGKRLLEAILPELTSFADVTLLGCGDLAERMEGSSAMRIIPKYERDELPKLLEDVRPEVGLLLSQITETFSYTLRELQALAVPTLTTPFGSFVDWIQDGVTGFLAASQPGAILDVLRSLSQDKQRLQTVHDNLQKLPPPKTPKEMVAEYGKLQSAVPEAWRYFESPKAPDPLPRKAIQVYWRTGEHFDEFSSSTVAPRGRARQALRLSIPPQTERLAALRVDFGVEPSLMKLFSLVLRDANENALWTWTGDPGLWQHVSLQQIIPLTASSAPPTVLGLTGKDAHFILPLDQDQLLALEHGGSLTVEVAFDERTSDDEAEVREPLLCTLEALTSEAEALRYKAAEATREAERKLAEAEYQMRLAQLQLEQARLENDLLTHSLSWRLTTPLRWAKALLRSNN